MLLQLFDGRLVETVGIPADADGGGRLTVCVSSQVCADPALPCTMCQLLARFCLPFSYPAGSRLP